MKDFVQYQEALELKQLGFDEPCIAKYNVPGDLITTGCYTDSHITHLIVEQSDICEAHVLAPTYSQAFRFFRNKHNINTVISWRDDLLNYDISLTEMKKHGYFYYKDNFTTYEEAELACLQKLIELIKK